MGRPTSTLDPNLGSYGYHFDGLGQLLGYTRNGRNSRYEYDALGRRTSAVTPDGSYRWSYDGDGSDRAQVGQLVSDSLTSSTLGDVTTSYAYRNPGALLSSVTKTVRGGPLTFEVENDGLGRPEHIRYPSVGATSIRTTLQYDPFGANNAALDSAGALLWRLDDVSPFGSAAQVTLGNQSLLVRDYEPTTGLIASSTLSTLDRATTFESEQLTYEARGLLHTRTRLQQERETFLHDPLARLKEHARGQQLDVYGYDLDGKLTQKPDIGVLTYGSANRHAVTSTADGRHFSYDADGRQEVREGTDIRRGRQQITYTEFDLPATVRSGTTDVELRSYGYDASHERVLESTVGGDETVTLAGGLFRRTQDAAGALRFVAQMPGVDGLQIELFDDGDGLKSRFAMTDSLGSVIHVADPGRQSLERRDYQPFGKSSSLLTTRLGFTGHESDVELGLINMRGRIYDPAIGRFLTPDPLLGSAGDSQAWNRYSYVGNNPLNAVDPSGFQQLCAAPADGIDRGQGCIPLPGPTVGNTSGDNPAGSGTLQGTVGTSSGRGNSGATGTTTSPGTSQGADVLNASQSAAASAVFGATAALLASLPSGNAINLQPSQTPTSRWFGNPPSAGMSPHNNGDLAIVNATFFNANDWAPSWTWFLPLVGRIPGAGATLDVALTGAGRLLGAVGRGMRISAIEAASTTVTRGAANVASRSVGAAESAFSVAQRGGLHSGFLKNIRNYTAQQLQKVSRSLQKNIELHEGYLENPLSHVPNFNSLPGYRQEWLMKHWATELKNFTEQQSIVHALLP